MTKIELTQAHAHSAGQDAANRRMRSEGRKSWNEGDLSLARAVSAKFLLDIPVEDGGLKGLDESILRREYPSLFRGPTPG